MVPSTSATNYQRWFGGMLMVVVGLGLYSIPCYALQPSDFVVKGLEKVEPAFASFKGIMYAGMMPYTNKRKHDDSQVRGELMFWFFAPEEPKVDDSMVIWLNGGPGCSSLETGNMFENGPVTVGSFEAGYCCMTNNESFVYNEYAWTGITNMLFVEQPAGTGFSHGVEPQDEEDLSWDFYSFLVNFYEVFEEFSQHRLFLFGESYAGMYIPSIARRIYLENNKTKTSFKINLAGTAIGNGLIDVTVQSTAMIDYAYWHGMIDAATRKAFYDEWQHCYPSDTDEIELSPYHPFTVPDECGIMKAILKAAGADLVPDRAPNTYDVTTWDTYPVLEEGSNIQEFFNKPAVREALNAPKDIFWRGCIPGEGRRRLMEAMMPGKLLLDDDQPIAVDRYIAELLDAGIDVLIYNGDRDMACCAQGSEMVLNRMEWSGADDWKEAGRGLWIVEGEMAGWAKRAGNLEFVVVFNSGHMVPTNQPINALDLLHRLLTGKHFSDAELPSFTDGLYVKEQQHPQLKKNTPVIYWPKDALIAVVCFLAGIFGASFIKKKSEYQVLD